MALTDASIKALKPKDKAYKVSDSNGLYLHISTTGNKTFRLDYQIKGKRKTLSIGSYPQIFLKESRQKCFEAKGQISNGVDPSILKQHLNRADIIQRENEFEYIAREWFIIKQSNIWVESHSKRIIRRLELYVFPYLRDTDIFSYCGFYNFCYFFIIT